MQVPRHWRMNANRYRMEGCEYKIDLEEKIDNVDWIITYMIRTLQKRPNGPTEQELSKKIEVSRRLKQGNDKVQEQRNLTAA